MRVRRVLALAALVVAAAAVAPVPGFRPPAIPLFTTEPLVQTWMMGSAATDDVVRYWDGSPREILGLLRVDSETFRFLGSQSATRALAPVSALKFAGADLAPGRCDISTVSTTDPNVCNVACQNTQNCRGFVITNGICFMKSCVDRVNSAGHDAYVIDSPSTVYVDSDIAPGTEISARQESSVQACSLWCQSTPNCVAFVHRLSVCSLRSASSPIVTVAGSTGYVPSFKPASMPTSPVRADIFEGTDISPGKCDIARHQPMSMTECNRWCSSVTGCKAFVVADAQTCYLKSCAEPRIMVPDHSSGILVGEASSFPGYDINSGTCDITSYPGSADMCLESCYSMDNCKAFAIRDHTCFLKSCATSLVKNSAATAYVIAQRMSPSAGPKIPVLQQKSVKVYPTRTVFEFELPGKLAVNVTLLSTLFTDDWFRLSRPISYVHLDTSSLDGKSHTVSAYLDASPHHCTQSLTEVVDWSVYLKDGNPAVRMGTTAQKHVGVWGDHVGINWGYLHLSGTSKDYAVTAAEASLSRTTFSTTGTLAPLDTKRPRAADYSYPVIAVSAALGASIKGSCTFLFGYEDVFSVFYFGKLFPAYWMQKWATFADAVGAAAGEYEAMNAKSVAHDSHLLSRLSAVGGDEYATLGALAYRQTLAATKLTWNPDKKQPYNFLKEISTNGDMSTMDVIFPASPLLLYTDPRLLERLLVPVLEYANNETAIKFTDPYSPHQLGLYPRANDKPEDQEPMPLENSGNMILMLLGIVQRTNDTSFIYPRFWPLLKTWVDRMVSSLPCPAEQLCTDDFTGPLANNSNLALKGIVALEAFATLCDRVGVPSSECQKYRSLAKDFATQWYGYAFSSSPSPHFKISYNKEATSWSIKYNIVWQKLLKLNGPFDWQKVAGTEIAFYKTKMNKFGVPMDYRHTYVKLDWLSWAAVIADDADFRRFFDPIYAFANTSPSRCPLTDLYDTVSGAASISGAFVARPVNGAIYAKMLV